MEFLQSKENRNIKNRLQTSITKCISVKGAVAFWSIDKSYFAELTEKLAHEDSYFCVDIHQPTDIDSLSSFVEKGANIYLFLYRQGTGRFPLMHSKFIVFELEHNQVEIWVGSQNFTHNALGGKNIEATSIITTQKNSDLYREVLLYLNAIKVFCEDIGTKLYTKIGGKFNLNFIDFYKKLQKSFDFQEKNYDVICNDISDISIKQKDDYVLIVIFGKDISNKFSPSKTILVRALDKNAKTICYEAEIRNVDQDIPIDKDSNFFVTTYHGKKDNKRYEVSSYIICKENENEQKLLPIFITSKPYDITEQAVLTVIIEIKKEFTKPLYQSQKGDFWIEVTNIHKGKNLIYLNIAENVRIPKSPKDVEKESSHQFEKIQKLSPELRIEIIEETIGPVWKECQPKYKGQEYKSPAILDGRQSIIRKMVTREKHLAGSIDYRDRDNDLAHEIKQLI